MYIAVLEASDSSSAGTNVDSSRMYEALKRWLTVPGFQSYPYYRPFVSRGTSYWMNSNLAGSYAKSSLRDATKPLFYNGDNLVVPDCTTLSSQLLKGKTIPFWALVAFGARNSSFAADLQPCHLIDVIEIYKRELGIINESDFYTVFDFNLDSKNNVELEVVSDFSDGNPEFHLSNEAYRTLTADQLDLNPPTPAGTATVQQSSGLTSQPDDAILNEILDVMADFSGVILSGAPGTSKSYYAQEAAKRLTENDSSRVFSVQFHPSFEFGDFIEGYRPDEESQSFIRVEGIFLKACAVAESSNGEPVVIVIDELSRGDAARIFGEALTYIEKSKRGMRFTLPSGLVTSIPENVFIIATMNPMDRGADDVDLAFGRRFATIEMNPSVTILRSRLEENGMDVILRERLITWFIKLNKTCDDLEVPGLGHAFFWNVTDASSVRKAWKYQILPHIKKVLLFEKEARDSLVKDAENFLDMETGD